MAMKTDGLIRIYFKFDKGYDNCRTFEVSNVVTSPPNGIRGTYGFVKGTNKVPQGKPFALDVTPTTTHVTLLIPYQGDGRITNSRFNFEKTMKNLVLAGKSTNWRQAFQKTESRLAAKARADKTPPRIVLLSPNATTQKEVFRKDSYQTYIRGKVSDNEGVLTVFVNGKKAALQTKGDFAAKVKLALGVNRIKVQAEDINGNISERKIIIIREEYISPQIMTDVDMPPKTKMNNPNGVAVVIGVENYQYVSDATYAYNDAEVFREYLANTLGYRKSMIKIVTNSKATMAELQKLLGPNGWIARNVKAKTSDVVVYFSGHGIPDVKRKKTGLLPFDVDPNYSVGMTLKDLYTTLGTLDAKSVTVFLDTCFSGQGREQQALLKGTRGIMIVPKERNIPKPITVLSAATAGQVSGPIKDKEHGLFTYYVLKGLGGAADSNEDKQLTISELGSYVQSNVKEQAAAKGWNQTPELQGASERVLVRF